MKRVNIILMGFGHVGRESLRLISEKREFCRKHYCLDMHFHAVFRSEGAFINSSRLVSGDVWKRLQAPKEISKNPNWRTGFALDKALASCEPGVLVECTPSNIKDGEPGLSHIHEALERGWHVVTANKGPLVHDYCSLIEEAKRCRLALKFSGATAAALPCLDIALLSLAGTEILRIEGILNGTTNFILTRMKEGKDYDEALAEAQKRGIAESDPSLDVEGWDTASKIVLIANACFAKCLTLDDVRVEGIKDIPSHLLQQGREEGKVIRLLGTINREKEKIDLSVRLAVITGSHPLFGVDGTNKGLTLITDTMDSITVVGGKSDPRGAAAALLKDIIHIYHFHL